MRHQRGGNSRIASPGGQVERCKTISVGGIGIGPVLEQQLHRLFTTVLSPSEVSTNLPVTPQPSGVAAAREAGGGASRTTMAPVGEHRVSTTTSSAVSTTTSTPPLLMLSVPLPLP